MKKSIKHYIQNSYQSERKIKLFLFFFTLAVSLCFLHFTKNIGTTEQQTYGTDYTYYYAPTAESLLQGVEIPFENETGIRYPIGYPAFLTIPFTLSNLFKVDRIVIIRILNILLTAGSTYLLYRIARTFVSKNVAVTTGVLWALYPLNLWLIKLPNSEVPFIFLFYAGLYIYIKAIQKISFNYTISSGVLLGLATLVRPITITLPLILALLLYLFLKKQQWRIRWTLPLCLLLSYSAVISPWILYLYFLTGKFLPLSTNGPIAIAGGMEYLIMTRGGGSIQLPSDVTLLIQKLSTIDTSAITNLATFFIHALYAQPITVLKLIGIKLVRSWYGTSEFWFENLIFIIQLHYLISAVCGIILLFKKIKDKIVPTILIVTICYMWMMTTIVLSIIRYMIPVMGFIMIFSAFTVHLIFDIIKNSKNTTLIHKNT